MWIKGKDIWQVYRSLSELKSYTCNNKLRCFAVHNSGISFEREFEFAYRKYDFVTGYYGKPYTDNYYLGTKKIYMICG